MTEDKPSSCIRPEQLDRSIRKLAKEHRTASICILSQTHLCRNPRVWKECRSLSEAGYSVVVLTTLYDDKMYQEDVQLLQNTTVRYECYADLRRNRKNHIAKLYLKSLRKLGNWLVRSNLFNTALSLGYGHRVLYKKALNYRADLYICHQEMASYVGTQLLKKGKKVAFDIEDWYSEDLLPEARKNRPIALLQKVERTALSQSSKVWTTSVALAKAMASTYHTPAPAVIYNTFPSVNKERETKCQDRVDPSKVSLFWFSQTIGPGRGLEILINALRSVDLPFELHLRGIVSHHYKEMLSDQFPKQTGQTLHFHPLVSNEELPLRIAEHDIGLALESQSPPSRNFTITNKILQYLEAGIAVVASTTAGQKEVAAKAPEAVFLFDHTESLTASINQLLSDREALKRAKCQAKELFSQHFLWESEAEKLCQLVETALHP